MPLSARSLAGYTVVYGGSFNPPHLGHQMSCLYLLEGLAAAAVWLVPVYRHPFGKQVESFAHRVAMCELMAAPFAGRVQVLEVERELGGISRTYDTLAHLRAQHPGLPLALAIGADNLGELPRWYRCSEMEATWPVVVVGRSGFDSHGLAPLDIPGISSSELRACVRQGTLPTGLVPESVAQFITKNGLYRDAG